MKYLRAIISSDTRGTLYKKDFKVENVFDLFVRTFVSTLITTGLLNKGDLYSTLIIPRYGKYREVPPQITVHGHLKEGEKRSWVDLEFEDGIDPEKPIDFFTLDIFVVAQFRSYRSNFQMSRINYFWRSIEQALAQVGVLRYKEEIQRKLYAHDDEQGDFEHEEMQVLQDATATLIEIVPDEIATSSFPRKSLADFNIQSTRRLYRGKLVVDAPGGAAEENPQSGVQILITQSVLESVQQIARSDVKVEQGGALVGDVYEDAATTNREYIVEINAHIPAEETFANEVELRYTFQSWQKQTSLLRERFPEKRIVGWYHTHLDLVKRTYYTDASHQDMYTTPLFFSQDDSFTHRQFFREKWYVAMVLDQQGNLTFYQWVGDEIRESRRFYVVDAEKEE